MKKLHYHIRRFPRDGGEDIFISAESMTSSEFRIMWGYCRVYFCEKGRQIPFLKGKKGDEKKKYGMIRELKVNGSVSAVGGRNKSAGQHRGIGSRLLEMAEECILAEGYSFATVTSAVGVREYYEKKGYQLDECGLMWKNLEKKTPAPDYLFYWCLFFLTIYMIYITTYLEFSL